MKAKVLEKQYVIPFILLTTLFALWGFANDITNPMVAAFQTVMEIPASQAALVQFAFYGGYSTMAIPAALFVSRFNYKAGVLLGLALYCVGALLFYPAAKYEMFSFFLFSLYILTFGLAFLETTANPYILSMGDPQTATRRLNLAQSFNPLGSILGMFVASQFVLTNLDSDKRDAAGNLIFPTLSAAEKTVIKTHDLAVIRDPYIILGFVVLAIFIIIALYKMPKTRTEQQPKIKFGEALGRLSKNAKYREGVIAQVFYVATQIMCWTFIIQYAERLGFTKAEAQHFNIMAMALFLISRFVSTALMKYLKAELMLMLFALGGLVTILGVIFSDSVVGVYCLIMTSGFMSLMFPTIYGIALCGLKEESTLGAAGLVMAIVGGALMPPLQGAIIDLGTVAGLPAVNASFVLPLICFIVIAIYGYRCWKVLK
ncbi:L-fucose:H+ symporter permease [Gallibacterium anatis]|uniref:Major facilitator transporter n=4 Tax=Gallibacterium TaxID=155493 RepID=A0A0A2Y5H1_9PAST|nr:MULTISPECIES: L-fucose:H+ symporter permease [Gallibacterium]AEC17260.1 L-fucose transporter [Gallibacterium anatis UMN179]ERF78480.1 major facilitator transporter [Gallibacterium anatis 12656/12]KGQ24208.1 major facilitator transporter [Gallibacterium anatis CCM5995]KGQ37845.1 major facilitator transporter [Gallibacterium genomosp. 1]KGQ43434.1 major facilitator transporter [Gallibacterium anatis]